MGGKGRGCAGVYGDVFAIHKDSVLAKSVVKNIGSEGGDKLLAMHIIEKINDFLLVGSIEFGRQVID